MLGCGKPGYARFLACQAWADKRIKKRQPADFLAMVCQSIQEAERFFFYLFRQAPRKAR